MKFKKVADIQDYVLSEMGNHRRNNAIFDYFYSEGEFTVKKAHLRIKYANSQGYYQTAGWMKTEVEKRDDVNLIVSLNYEKENYSGYYGRSYPNAPQPSEELFSDILAEFCRYWLYYKEYKKIKRVMFYITNYKNIISNDAFVAALKKLGLVEIKHSKNIIAIGNFRSGAALYRENNVDEKISLAEFLYEEFLQAKKKYPSFEISQTSGQFFKIFAYSYYFDNETFKILPGQNEDLILKRKNKEDVHFKLEEGVVLKIVEYVRSEMSLVNVLHPPIKQLKEFISVSFETYKIEDETLEDVVREVDETLGYGETENEIGLIVKQLKSVEIKYDKGRKLNKPKDFFYITKEENEYFKEKYGDEFEILFFKTDKYYWYIMYSENEKKVWLYPEKQQSLPLKLKEDAESVFRLRRDTEKMEKLNDAIEALEYLNERKKFKTKNYKIKSDLKSLKELGNSEFGFGWRDKISTTHS